MSGEHEGTTEAPATPKRPVTEEKHGHEIVDPYRWLEENSDEVREWEAAENAYAEKLLTSDVKTVLEGRFAELAHVTDFGQVKTAGGRLFQKIKEPEKEQPVLRTFESATELERDDGRTLVDPNALDRSGTVSLDWYVPGPSGDRVAYGLAEGGDEQYDIHLLDLDTDESREVIHDAGRTSADGFGWTPGGFYYVATGGMGEEDGGQLEKEVRHHRLGDDQYDDIVIADSYEEQQWPGIETDGRDLVVTVMDGWASSEVYAYRGDPRTATLAPVISGVEASFTTTLTDGTLYLLTDFEAPRSRVLACPFDRATARQEALDPTTCREVIPEGDGVLRDIEPAGTRLLIHAHHDAASQLHVYADSGSGRADRLRGLDLPGLSTVTALDGTKASPTAFFSVESFTTPPSVARAELGDGSLTTLQEVDIGIDIEVTVTQDWFESADGTDVPAFVVSRADLDLSDGPHPTVLTGYGGFRVNRTPTFDRFRLPFIQAGGVFVLATLRGGSEFGEEWHEAGRRENKEHVFEDAEAVAEGLIDRGVTSRDRLGVTGGSNGGLLVGALITRRPELFRAAVCRVPLLDMLRFHQFLLGAAWTVEYGHPEDPDAFEYLRTYSPYHNVEEAPYPATLFTTARGDARVHPSHARKMTPLLREHTTSGGPVLLRVRDETGHGVGKPTSMQVEEQAELWGFLAQELGVSTATLQGADG